MNALDAVMARLRDPHVRDLAWSVGSPNLVSSPHGLHLVSEDESLRWIESNSEWLLQLDADPASLHDFLKDVPVRRVGLRFESLFRFWLSELPDYQLLAHHHQVYRQRQTMGAFDFIVRSPAGGLEHWELAVKFYLQHGDVKVAEDWVGPNGRDRLSTKICRMKDHQLPLSNTDEGQAAIAALAPGESVVQRAWLKGILFRTLEQGWWDNDFPHRGIWLEVGQLSRFLERCPTRLWVYRSKPNWLAPMFNPVGEEAILSEHLLSRLADRPILRPEMWSLMVRDGVGLWVEERRLFIVPDDWYSSRLSRAL